MIVVLLYDIDLGNWQSWLKKRKGNGKDINKWIRNNNTDVILQTSDPGRWPAKLSARLMMCVSEELASVAAC